MAGVTNTQIYNELVDFRGETRKQLDELNGRVRSNAEAVVVALDRTKRIGEEVNHHADEKDAHGGATAKVTATSNIKIALIGLGGGFLAGLMTLLANILAN